MTTNYLSPVFNEQNCDSSGDPLVGGFIYTYTAGTSTAASTYTTQSGLTEQANPIVLNSRGEPDNPIWLFAGSSYKFVLKDVNGTTIRTIDNVKGINDLTTTVSEWQASGLTPTYISSTSFSLTDDKTVIFHVGRRLKTTNTGGTTYSVIATSAYSGGITTITVTNDSGTIDSGISDVSYAVVSAVNTSLPNSAAVRTAMGVLGTTDNAVTATTATHISGGAAGQVLYQSGAGATAKLAAGTATQVLYGGASAPAWGTVPTTDYQTFTASGTWTKPSSAVTDSRVFVEAWGAGGGGSSGGGGGGGGYNYKWFLASELTDTVTVTIGAGGAADPAGATAGGNTTFGAYLTAYGGGSGAPSNFGGGGGGGMAGAGASGSGTTGGAGGAGSYATTAATNGTNFDCGATAPSAAGAGYTSYYGGGSGAYCSVANAGGKSVYGGGGGGTSGGTSVFGGAGGTSAAAGTAPGGGGGTNGSTAGTAGARGEVRVTVFI